MIDAQLMKYEERAVFALRRLYEQYGYQPFKMSRFEEYELYLRNQDFLVSKEVITFTDSNGRLLAMKPDVTLSIIKKSHDQKGAVEKVYYHENVYRTVKGTHTFKEIMQAGLECIGDLSDYEIAEVVLLALKSLALMGKRYLLDLSHMGLISAVLESSGLSAQGQKEALGFLNQKNAHELLELCQREGARSERLLALLSCSGAPRAALEGLAPLMETEAELAAFSSFKGLCAILQESGFEGRFRVDFSVGNDMKYYSGVVFKGYLEGIPAGILSGGQYDKLLEKMGRRSGAVGFAVYLDLLEQLEEQGEPGADILLLYEEGEAPAAIAKAVEQLLSEGKVLAAKTVPADQGFSRIIKMREGRMQDA